MKEQLVSFEIAKLAKGKRFPIIDRGFYINGVFSNRGFSKDFHKWYDDDSLIQSAPTQSSLQKWLFEEHDIDIIILPIFDRKKCNYDSHKRIGFRSVITQGDCIYQDWSTFIMHPYNELEYSNKEDDVKETFEEFLERISLVIFDDKYECLENGLQEALKLIK